MNDLITHYILVEIKTKNKNKLINKLNSLNIKIYNIVYKDESIIIKITYNNYKKLKNNLFYYDINYLSDFGIYQIKNKLKKYYIFFIAIVIGIFLLFGLNHLILDVNVVHSNKYIRRIVTNALEDAGVKKFTIKKSYDELNAIKKAILEKYPEDLEWLEIEVVGMTYQVKIEQRIITKPSKNNNTCHIIAAKNAMITKLIPIRGVPLVNVNTYVKKGDILISGAITFNEEVKNNVCAMGTVYGEVWYTVNVSLPLAYEKKEYTGKKRFNLAYSYKKNNGLIFKNRLKKYITKQKKLFSLFGLTIYLNTDYEITIKSAKYTESQAISKGLALAKEKLSLQINQNERILSQKVLKKSINNSKMELEVFSSVEEQIGKQQYYDANALKNKENDDES